MGNRHGAKPAENTTPPTLVKKAEEQLNRLEENLLQYIDLHGKMIDGTDDYDKKLALSKERIAAREKLIGVYDVRGKSGI